MEHCFKREEHKGYLVIKSDSSKITENGLFRVKMLENEVSKKLLKMETRVFNGETSLYYDVSGKQSLSLLFEKKLLSNDTLSTLFFDMQDVYDDLSDCLLDTENLIPDPEFIFRDLDDGHFYFLYHPFIVNEYISGDEFAEFLLDHIADRDEKAVMLAYEFYRFIKEEDGDISAALFRLTLMSSNTESDPLAEEDHIGLVEEPDMFFDDTDDMEILESAENRTAVSKPKKNRLPLICLAFILLTGLSLMMYSIYNNELSAVVLFSQKEFLIGMSLSGVAVCGIVLSSVAIINKHRNNKANSVTHSETPDIEFSNPEETDLEETYRDDAYFFGSEASPSFSSEADTTDRNRSSRDLPDDDNRTMLIEDNIYREQRILSGRIHGKKKEIDLSDFPFIVGKSRDGADFVIDDKSVSRLHARFTLRDDIVFLTDLNSMNGTYKNGIRVEPNELVMLEKDDEIRFGRCVFTYL